MQYSVFQTGHYEKEITDDLYLHWGYIEGECSAFNVYTSEAYAGTQLGNAFVWQHEALFSSAIATARALLLDYEMALEISKSEDNQNG